uniref:Uncharacterized protein n=1 Tax=Hordeum vulgare subsp. vulgare TaxID=112509 RepID=A0A8I6Z1U6_HORVV
MVATITGSRPPVAADEVADALFNNLELQPGDFSIHLNHPKDFLIVCASQAIKDRIYGDHHIEGPSFSLSLCPWSKLAHAGYDSLGHRVELELRGVPA